MWLFPFVVVCNFAGNGLPTTFFLASCGLTIFGERVGAAFFAAAFLATTFLAGAFLAFAEGFGDGLLEASALEEIAVLELSASKKVSTTAKNRERTFTIFPSGKFEWR